MAVSVALAEKKVKEQRSIVRRKNDRKTEEIFMVMVGIVGC